MRMTSLALVGALTLATVAAATAIVDEPMTEQELRHQRIHEQKLEDTAEAASLPGPVPTTRLSDEPCVDGWVADIFPCEGVDLLSFVPNEEFIGSGDQAQLGFQLSDIWGWTDAETGDEYVMLGKTNGVGFFRVTDPTDPVYLGELPNRAAAHLVWHDIKVYQDHAFIVSESAPHGMSVFDLTKLRGVEEPQTFMEDGFYPLPASAHNIAINEDTGYAYIVGGNAGLAVPDHCASGLHMVDISEPTLPIFAGCQVDEGPGTAARVAGGAVAENSPLGYVHDTQCVVYDGPDSEHHGKEICVNSSEVALSIVDVTDKLNPVQLSVLEYEQTGYTHQGWFTEDQRFFLMGDEGDEQDFGVNTRTLLFDLSDLDDPQLAGDGEHLNETTSIDHNLYTLDGLAYQSNYTTGLRVMDTDDIAAGELEQVAFFDSFPQHDNPVFAGTWSNYPYFDSGTIAMTGSGEGLFLLRVHDEVLAQHAGPRGEEPTAG